MESEIVPPNTAMPALDGSGLLRAFAQAADASFRWRIVQRGQLLGRAFIEAEFVSQRWRGHEWNHRLWLFEPPPGARPTDQGFLFVSGEDTPEQHDAWRARGELPGQALLFSALAREVEGPVALLLGVPNEPAEGPRGDAYLATTLAEALASGDPTEAALLPMVKAVVRALDVLQELSQADGVRSTRFLLAGASKRAWTSWLAAAIEPRVNALVPAALEVPNMVAQLAHQREVWGAIADGLHFYVERGVLAGLEASPALRAVLDPHEHRAALGMPKFTLLAANDALYPVDALPLHWHALPGEKDVLYLMNQDHELAEHACLPGSLHAFHARVAHDTPLPRLSWSWHASRQRVELELETEAPLALRQWSARSGTRDFRRSTWYARPLGKAERTHVPLEAPGSGFTAHLVEVLHAGPGSPLHRTTTAAVLDARGTLLAPHPGSGKAGA